MKVIVSHYQGDASWLLEHDYFIYARTPLDDRFDPARIRYVENVGNCDYDRLTYLVENYDNLPDVFLLTKSNLFKYITSEEFDSVKDNKCFTPLLTQHHKTYEPVCRYTNGMYEEIANSWFLKEVPAKCVRSWEEWCDMFNLPKENYIPFAPGGNYILTRETVQKHPKELYDTMRQTLPYTQLPGEAQCVERSYNYLWR